MRRHNVRPLERAPLPTNVTDRPAHRSSKAGSGQRRDGRRSIGCSFQRGSSEELAES